MQRRHDRLVQLEVREEQQLQELRNRQALAAVQEHAREKERDKQSIIHELVRDQLARSGSHGGVCGIFLQMTSERPAREVLASHSALIQQEGVGPGGGASSIKRDLTQPTFQVVWYVATLLHALTTQWCLLGHSCV